MIIRQDGIPCRCGNRGCFEHYASDEMLKHSLSENDIELYDYPTYEALQENTKAREIFDDYIAFLTVGLNNIINIFNPKKLIISPLGDCSSALGAAIVPLARFLDINHLDLNAYHYTH